MSLHRCDANRKGHIMGSSITGEGDGMSELKKDIKGKCLCKNCNGHGWVGCPRGDAEEEVVRLKAEITDREALRRHEEVKVEGLEAEVKELKKGCHEEKAEMCRAMVCMENEPLKTIYDITERNKKLGTELIKAKEDAIDWRKNCGLSYEHIVRLEAEVKELKKAGSPLYGEARSRILKECNNARTINEGIAYIKQLKDKAVMDEKELVKVIRGILIDNNVDLYCYTRTLANAIADAIERKNPIINESKTQE